MQVVGGEWCGGREVGSLGGRVGGAGRGRQGERVWRGAGWGRQGGRVGYRTGAAGISFYHTHIPHVLQVLWHGFLGGLGFQGPGFLSYAHARTYRMHCRPIMA